MSTPNTLRHFVGYFFRDTANKALLAFTGLYFLIFSPLVLIIDHQHTKFKYGYVPLYHSSGGQSLIWFGLLIIAIWIAVVIYQVIKYKKYLNKNL